MPREYSWLGPRKRKRERDYFEEYMSSTYPSSIADLGHHGFIVAGNREIWAGDPLWPGDAIAAKITRLYYRLVPNGKPRRYERKVARLLGIPVYREPPAIGVEDTAPVPRKKRRQKRDT